MSIVISLTPSAIKTNQVARVEMTWPELVAWLCEDHVWSKAKTELPGWIPAEFRGATRGNDHVKWVTVAVIDLDAAELADLEQLHARLRALQLDYVWHSSFSHSAEQPKFRFAVRLSRPVLRDEWLRVWRGLAEIAPKLDQACKDPTRLYFVPGHPPDAPHEAGSFEGGHALDVEVLLAHATSPAGMRAQVRAHADEEAPTVKAWRQLGKKHAEGVSASRALGGRAMLALVEAQDFAPVGERDTALFQVAAILAKKYPNTPAAALVEPVREELLRQTQHEKWDGGDGATSLERKIERLQAEHADAESGTDSARLEQLGRAGPYTEDEIQGWVFQLGLRDPAQLALQLIVSCRGSYWVFYEGRYIYAGSKENGEEFVRARLQPAVSLPGVTLLEMGKDGIKDRSMGSLVRSYGTTVELVADSLVAQQTTIDLRSAPTRMTIASAPRDRRRAQGYSATVERTLRMMVSDVANYERLLDWLATAPRLERATAALYLHGGKRTGKSQLARGLAAVWGQRPTELEEVGANFNEHLAKSPVVFADESLPWEWRQDSGKLRRLITTTQHALRQKFQENKTLDGALRVVLAANNLHLLMSPSETLDQWDIEAICERVMYVHCGDQEVPYVEPHEFAEHVLWLEGMRHVEPDGRLWVSGVDSPLHRALRTQGRRRAAVCQWLLKFLENPALAGGFKHRFRMGPEGLFIAPRVVHEAWETYMGGERRLELPQITAAIFEISQKGLAKGMVKIRLEDVAQFAAAHCWGIETVEELEELVCKASAQQLVKSN